jgi:hypothetical protein
MTHVTAGIHRLIVFSKAIALDNGAVVEEGLIVLLDKSKHKTRFFNNLCGPWWLTVICTFVWYAWYPMSHDVSGIIPGFYHVFELGIRQHLLCVFGWSTRLCDPFACEMIASLTRAWLTMYPCWDLHWMVREIFG